MIGENKKGLLHIYAGDGKGKTTAAVGLSVRCAGNGGRVIFTQFLKDNQSSELNLLRSIECIQVILPNAVERFYWEMSEEEKAEAKILYSNFLQEVITRAIKEECQMLVLDEIIAAYNLQLVEQSALVNFLKSKPQQLEVVLTGRNPAEELLDLADYVSEIKKVKHPYDVGIGARNGIEK